MRAAIKKHHTPQTTLEGPDPLTRRPRDTLVGHRGHSHCAWRELPDAHTRAHDENHDTQPEAARSICSANSLLLRLRSPAPSSGGPPIPKSAPPRSSRRAAPPPTSLLGERHSLRLHGSGQIGGDRDVADALHGPA